MHILAAGKQEETTNFDEKKIENEVCTYLLSTLLACSNVAYKITDKARIIWKWQFIILWEYIYTYKSVSLP